MAALPGFRSLLALSLLLGAALPALAADGFLKTKPKPDALLPVDQAFQFEGVSRETGALVLRWSIAPGYYLYRHQLKVSADSPAQLKLPALDLPQGEAKDDPEFGPVQTYHGALTAKLPLATGAAVPKTLRVRYQGCADIGVCYPPQTKLVAVR